MDSKSGLNPHEKPPDLIRASYKYYQRLKPDLLSRDDSILDFHRALSAEHQAKLKKIYEFSASNLQSIFDEFEGPTHQLSASNSSSSVAVYEHEDCPGLRIIPSAIPLTNQKTLLDRLLHRDLVNPTHLTNVHLHHHIKYPTSGRSFFSIAPDIADSFEPKDAKVHSPLPHRALLERKLRWVTLGGQYDWTEKEYPLEKPPAFPADIARMLNRLCPDISPEAAICNLYTPGDTLSLHRDVSELCDAPLLSLSIGCDAVFLLSALREEDDASGSGIHPPVALRLHSGDLVYMAGASRFAWHGVPKVIADTCPDTLSNWPGESFTAWSGWMQRKRINLNVRQMYPSA